jgi:hypothetical protein
MIAFLSADIISEAEHSRYILVNFRVALYKKLFLATQQVFELTFFVITL